MLSSAWQKRTSMTKVRVGRVARDASSLLWSVQLLMSAPVWRHTSRTDAPFGPAACMHANLIEGFIVVRLVVHGQ